MVNYFSLLLFGGNVLEAQKQLAGETYTAGKLVRIDLDEDGRALEGVLAVQVHVGPAMRIQYRDFKIKHLSDDLPLQKAEDHPIPADAYGVRPQGKLPNGWKAPVYAER